MVKPLANYLQLVPAEPFPPGWKRRLYGRHGCPPLLQTSHFLLANNDLQIKFRFVPDHDVPSGKLPPPNPLLSGLHFRGHLPHLKKEGAAYFVTFRLADSLPAGEIVRLKQERQAILEQSRAAKRPLTWHEEQQLLAWYCDRVESLLDAGRGACWLSQPAVADLVADALRFFAGQRYELRAWVVMPNHVHAIVWPMPGHILSDILHSWKSFTSKRAQQILPMRDKANRLIIGFAMMRNAHGWRPMWKIIPAPPVCASDPRIGNAGALATGSGKSRSGRHPCLP